MTNINERIQLLEKQIVDERAKISTDRMDMSFGELMNMYSSEELIIRPEYQRLFRWTDTQKTALIESILLGIPIPPIFVAEDEQGIWELVDGLQRISTILSFFGNLKTDSNVVVQQSQFLGQLELFDDDMSENINNWELGSGTVLKELEGFTSSNLPKKYQLNIKRAVCRVEILRGQSQVSMKYELFKRLNSGGSKLSAQEIRNAIYRGMDSSINELIEELSKNEIFIKLTSLSEQRVQVLYDQELVLRFIAFYGRVDQIDKNTGDFLDKFMEKSVESHDFNKESNRDLFNSVMDLLGSLNDDKIFRNKNNLFVPAWFEGITIGTAQNLAFYSENPNELERRVKFLKNDDEFKRLSGTASNSKTRVKKRLQRVEEIFEPLFSIPV